MVAIINKLIFEEIKSAFDVQKQTAGIQKERDWTIGSATVQEIVASHGKARQQFKRAKLRWRSSSGSKRALGWIPFKSRAAVWKNGQVKFAGHLFKVWDSYGLSAYQFRAGSFSEDSRGHWYFNVCVQIECKPTEGTSAVGVDLGLKETATPSAGKPLAAGHFYRDMEGSLGKAQRANKKARVKAIHAKIKNRRKDALHIDFESGEFNLYFYETICGGNELSLSFSIPVECLSAQNLKSMAFSLIDNKSSGR